MKNALILISIIFLEKIDKIKILHCQIQTSITEILNVGSAADCVVLFSLHCLCQPLTQRSLSPILTSKFDYYLKIIWIKRNTLHNEYRARAGHSAPRRRNGAAYSGM